MASIEEQYEDRDATCSSNGHAFSHALKASCEQLEDRVRMNPTSTVVASLGAGLGVGILVGLAIGGSRKVRIFERADQSTAERLGQHLLHSISEAVPESVRKHFTR